MWSIDGPRCTVKFLTLKTPKEAVRYNSNGNPLVKDIANLLASAATKRTYKKGSVLLHQGEAPQMAYVIKNGHIKAYSISNTGEEQIVTFHSANDIFPGPWIFGKTPTTLYYYEAFSDCEVLTVPRDVLMEMLQKTDYMPQLIDYLATNYTGLLMRVTALEQSRAREKIMLTLYHLLFRYGTENKPGIFTIKLPLTHSVIASLVGLTRETTTAELNALRQQKIIQYSKRAYRIHKIQLERAIAHGS